VAVARAFWAMTSFERRYINKGEIRVPDHQYFEFEKGRSSVHEKTEETLVGLVSQFRSFSPIS
jgi:hypothetical protein